MADEARPKLRCFLAIPFASEFAPVRDAVKKGIEQAGARAASLEDVPSLGYSLIDVLVGELARADFLIADLSGQNPNVYYELGLAQAMEKGVVLCARRDMAESIPVDLRGFRIFLYEPDKSGLASLSASISQSLQEFRRAPRRPRYASGTRTNLPFFVDWSRLDRSEIENLCRELLAQMGYLSVDWSKEIPELDLIAELPRKDPDGFEYRELWLVAMGGRAPLEMLFEWVSRGPDYLFHRLMRRGDSRLGERFSARRGNLPLTLLFISATEESKREEFEELRNRFSERARMRDDLLAGGYRLRFWDRDYLSLLVQQFPQIGFKYFSDEARSRSKFRKTPEELYQENLVLVSRLSKLVQDLEDEKNRRVRAERDAVWKDISFAAAHKIGNPIFAIETDLDPLHKRVVENRTKEAVEVLDNIRSSVEKAKAIIDQFKSLTRAQEIAATPTLLLPILEAACRTVKNQDVNCNIKCPEELLVQGDPERLAECFDELAVNSTHWFKKGGKLLSIKAIVAPPSTLPASLDSSRQYALIHFRDNGIGIPIENKTRIFDAFFTTHEHGTGLGLALVRRIIEGHGGTIAEVGNPDQGADFEIYFPLAPQNDPKPSVGRPKSKKQKKKRK